MMSCQNTFISSSTLLRQQHTSSVIITSTSCIIAKQQVQVQVQQHQQQWQQQTRTSAISARYHRIHSLDYNHLLIAIPRREDQLFIASVITLHSFFIIVTNIPSVSSPLTIVPSYRIRSATATAAIHLACLLSFVYSTFE